ncbi:MAG: neutral/alkaline ceramidase [bacterium]|nr:neutral/alkaline ceramidase [bacterium]
MKLIRTIFYLLLISIIILPGCFQEEKSSSSQLSPAAAALQKSSTVTTENPYLLGTGIYDITGPAAEVGMMGMSDPAQKTRGIVMRLRSRAFIIGDGGGNFVVYVVADLAYVSHAVKQGVISYLNSTYGGIYNDRNVLLSGTHTHGGPGGYSKYLVYDAAVLGFIKENYDVVVSGICKSIDNAHTNLAAGRILINSGDVSDAGQQRSEIAYDNNPAAERAQYANKIDKGMTLLKFIHENGSSDIEIGSVNWHALHPTNMGVYTKLISGDNKGYASYLFEEVKGTDYLSSDTFVAAFAQTNSGDVSPNMKYGPPATQGSGDTDYLIESDYDHMVDMGNIQYQAAKSLYDNAQAEVSGTVDFRHMYVDFSSVNTGSSGTTCAAAVGASTAAASSEDSPSPAALFDEGTTNSELSEDDADKMELFLSTFFPSFLGIAWPDTLDEDYVTCHGEKPILIPSGAATINGIPLSPDVLPVQIIKIGNIALVGVSFEVTTMAGRRMRDTVLSSLGSNSEIDTVIITSPSNEYSSYVTTAEEYDKQHYEGASTHYGPNTLSALQSICSTLTQAMENGTAVSDTATPRTISESDLVNFQTGVVFDSKYGNTEFGDVISQPNSSYAKGNTVTVTFWGGHPKNNLKTQGSFLKVEKIGASQQVCHEETVGCDTVTVCETVTSDNVPIAYDWDPHTRYIWTRDGPDRSIITIQWTIPADTDPGQYRIIHYGHWKSGWTGAISSYTGTSNIFTVNE